MTVIIPTANRPVFLETALESVARQSASHNIEEIIVSENLGNRESEEVCHKFKNLPIRYLFQDPILTSVQNIHFLMQQAKSEFVAFLCDDDWWSTGHLDTAITSLSKNLDASAFFSGCLFTESEAASSGFVYPRLPLWLASGKPKYSSQWILTMPSIFAISWIWTSFHLSTMVARREALMKASEVLLDSHPYYTDRILYPHLSMHGSIIYDPFIDTFIRAHQGNYYRDKRKEDLDKHHAEGSKKIFELGANLNLDLVGEWRRYFSEIPSEQHDDLLDVFRYALSAVGLEDYGFQEFVHAPLSEVKKSPMTIKSLLRAITPPVMASTYRKVVSTRKQH